MEAEKHTANNLLTEYKTEDSSAEREKKSYYFEVAKLIWLLRLFARGQQETKHVRELIDSEMSDARKTCTYLLLYYLYHLMSL